jgi:hypothetical protein
VICGAIAVVNILAHNLTHTEDQILIILGVSHWLLGGMVCWAFEGVRVEPPPSEPISPSAQNTPATEFHPASDFLLPGSRRNVLPWRH